MKKGLGVLIAACALLLAIAQPTLAKENKDKPLPILDDTSIKIVPGISAATYSGTLTTRPAKKGEGKRERIRRRNAADRCVEGREIQLYHGTFLIGTAFTDADGFWQVAGNKPPTGEDIRVDVVADDRKGVRCVGSFFFEKSP